MQNLTFTKYVYDEYYSEIFEKSNDFICSNKARLDLYSDSIELYDFSIGGVSFSNGNDSKILFSLSVIASIKILAKSRYDFESNLVDKWLTLSCSANLTYSGLSDFEILSTNEYSKSSYKRENPLTQYLIPYFSNDDLEKVANDFLNKYCPEALKTPMPLPIESIINKMNLICYEAPLKDGTFGMTYFSSNKATVYDENKNIKEITVNPGTILINSNSSFMTSVGSKNNTIIHECLHWELHRNFFILKKLLNSPVSSITCDTVKTYRPEAKDFNDSHKWMEWQASAISPKILMPRSTTRIKFMELMEEKQKTCSNLRLAEQMQLAIEELAKFYRVSNIAAKIRVIELGFEQAKGTFNYVDDVLYPPYSFNDMSLSKNQSFTVDFVGALTTFTFDINFRKANAHENFIYANGMFVINHPKYVYIEDNQAKLTDYALDNVDECCLIFEKKLRINTSYDDSFYRYCFLCKNVSSDNYVESTYNPDAGKNDNLTVSAAEMNKILIEANRIKNIFDNLPRAFSKTLVSHMDRLDITLDQLAERSGLSVVQLSNLRNDDNTTKTLQSVLAICIGLNLHKDFSYDLLKKAGFDVSTSMDELHVIIRMLIDHHSMETVSMWNDKFRLAKLNFVIPHNRAKEEKKIS